jgi:hypothetical protein
VAHRWPAPRAPSASTRCSRSSLPAALSCSKSGPSDVFGSRPSCRFSSTCSRLYNRDFWPNVIWETLTVSCCWTDSACMQVKAQRNLVLLQVPGV